MSAGLPSDLGLVGRDELLAEVVSARPRLLVLQGDSGIGKSALLRAAQARTNDALVLYAFE